MRTIDIDELLEDWSRRGLISAEQEEVLQHDLEARPAAPSVLREAVAYVGGVLVLVSMIVLVGQYWESLSDGVRVTLPAVGTLVLLLAGWQVRDTDQRTPYRLRAALWLVAVAGAATTAGLASHLLWGGEGVDVAVSAAATAAVVALPLYLLHRSTAQQLALLAGLCVTTGTAAAELTKDDLARTVAVWGVGLAWGALVWGGAVVPRRTGLLLAGAAAFAAALSGSSSSAALVLAVVTAAGLLAGAVALADPLLLGLAAFALLESLPAAASRFVPGRLSVPVTLLLVGSGLVVLALRRRDLAERTAPSWTAGTVRQGALLAAALTAGGLLAAVVIAIR